MHQRAQLTGTAFSITVALLVQSVSGSATAQAPAFDAPPLLSASAQMAMREAWLEQRHAALLPMMRKHGIDMWVVVNEEFHDDPLTAYVAPPRPYAGHRDFFVFIDGRDQGLTPGAVTGYADAWDRAA